MRPQRLRAERPWQEHAQLYRDLFADPGVAAALWPGRAVGDETGGRAAAVLAADIAHWEQRSFGPWIFFERETGVFVGRGGLHASNVESAECVEVLYAVRSDAWGRGYATEMAALAVESARRMGISEVVGFAATSNRASQRVLEKTGMRLRERLEHEGLPHVLGRLRTVL